jgi:hypothetical protein
MYKLNPFRQKFFNGSVTMSKNLMDANSSLRIQESDISDKIHSVKLFMTLKRSFGAKKFESRDRFYKTPFSGENFSDKFSFSDFRPPSNT